MRWWRIFLQEILGLTKFTEWTKSTVKVRKEFFLKLYLGFSTLKNWLGFLNWKQLADSYIKTILLIFWPITASLTWLGLWPVTDVELGPVRALGRILLSKTFRVSFWLGERLGWLRPVTTLSLRVEIIPVRAGAVTGLFTSSSVQDLLVNCYRLAPLF